MAAAAATAAAAPSITIARKSRANPKRADEKCSRQRGAVLTRAARRRRKAFRPADPGNAAWLLRTVDQAAAAAAAMHGR